MLGIGKNCTTGYLYEVPPSSVANKFKKSTNLREFFFGVVVARRQLRMHIGLNIRRTCEEPLTYLWFLTAKSLK